MKRRRPAKKWRPSPDRDCALVDCVTQAPDVLDRNGRAGLLDLRAQAADENIKSPALVAHARPANDARHLRPLYEFTIVRDEQSQTDDLGPGQGHPHAAEAHEAPLA